MNIVNANNEKAKVACPLFHALAHKGTEKARKAAEETMEIDREVMGLAY